ncbi:MAG: hypothetical protein KY469_22305 [Actinobacteria bacterium]|nr:hypothetical protein [Actinomycetota bacterium]
MNRRGARLKYLTDAGVLAVTAWAAVDAARDPDVTWPLALGVIVAWCVAMLLRDLHPRALLVVPLVLGMQAVLTGTFPNGSASTVLVVWAAAGMFGWRTRSWGRLLLGAVIWLIGLVPLALTMGNDPVTDLLFPTLFAWLAMGIGWLVALGRGRLRVAVGEAAAGERRLEAERAEIVTAERQRIARELNDVITQTVSSMQVQLAAARSLLVGTDPGAAVPSLLNVESAARDATAELRRMLGLLRHDMSEDSVPPDVSSTAIGRLTAGPVGVDVNVHVDPRVAELPAGLQVAAYRLVEWAVDDTRAGDGATRCRVAVTLAASDLVLSVSHDGDGDPSAIAAMRERTAVFAGELELSTDPDRTIAIRLPLPRPHAEVPA